MTFGLERMPSCAKLCGLAVVSYVLGFYTGGTYKDVKCCEKLHQSLPRAGDAGWSPPASQVQGTVGSEVQATGGVPSPGGGAPSVPGGGAPSIPGGGTLSVPAAPPSAGQAAPGWFLPTSVDLARREMYQTSLSGLKFHALSDLEIRLDMTTQDAENTFYAYLNHVDVECTERHRYGHRHGQDGGWDVCLAGPYKIADPCLIYSFGISNDWTFDDAISQQHNCVIRAFDPSINAKDHVRGAKKLIHFYHRGLGGKDGTKAVARKSWKLRSFANFRTEFGESDRVIDYLKIDVEFSEWPALETMLRDGSLRTVKQIGFEIHTKELGVVGRRTPASVTTVREFRAFYETLRGLESLGFRKWFTHSNPMGMFTSKRTMKRRSCCFEMIYINANLLLNNNHQLKPAS